MLCVTFFSLFFGGWGGGMGWGGGCMIEAESLKSEFCQVIDPVGELAALRALNLFDVGEDFGRLFFQR